MCLNKICINVFLNIGVPRYFDIHTKHKDSNFHINECLEIIFQKQTVILDVSCFTEKTKQFLPV